MMWTVILPVLVVRDKTLWAIDYKLDGTVAKSPCLIDEAEVYVAKEYHVVFPGRSPITFRYVLSHLPVFTLSRFKKWADRINFEFDWDRLIPSRLGALDVELSG